MILNLTDCTKNKKTKKDDRRISKKKKGETLHL